MRRIKHIQTHPHGTIWCNDSQSIEFLRISKCGSTTFTESLNLNNTKKFTDSNQDALKFACIRDPHVRFMSSIPETLKRLALTRIYDDDIIVSKTIYNHLRSANLSKAQDILSVFISTIENYGFFDAHHEPQIHFFLNNNGSIGYDPLCFDLDDMNNIIEGFAIKSQKLNSRQVLQKKKNATTIKQRIQFILGLTGAYNRNRNYLPLAKDSIQYKFMNEFEGKFNRLANHRDQLRKFLVQLYYDLQQHIDDDKYSNFIESYYKTDIDLHQKLKDNPLKKFTTIYVETAN